MTNCLKCEHPMDLHLINESTGFTKCSDLEGTIDGKDVICDCDRTELDNQKQKDKVDKRKEPK